TGVTSTTGTLSHLLCQGYTSSIDFVSFPQSPLAGSLDGRGWLRNIVAGSNIGASIVVPVPANVHWLLRSINYSFTAGAGVGNRVPFVTVRDAGFTQLALQLNTAVIVASNAVVMFAAAGQTQVNLQGVASSGCV